MTAGIKPGPWETLRIAGVDVPLYMLPFDAQGVLQAPLTAARLIEDLRGADPVDVLVISHGWNNDWTDALDLYHRFLSAYSTVVAAKGSPRPGARLVVVGVSWPSIALPATSAPAMAADVVEPPAGPELTAVAEAVVDPADRPEFYALAQSPQLDGAAALRMATLLAPVYRAEDGDLAAADPAGSAEDTVRLWAALQDRLDESAAPVVVSGPTGPRDSSAPPDPAGPDAVRPDGGGPDAAGLLSALDPRRIVRLATVLVMKDRAGVVGARGLGPVLAEVAVALGPASRIHLVGHSYGCKVVLSALCATPGLRVRSSLLLQAAMSYLALSDEVPTLNRPGGYHAAKGRCALGILATWSDEDFPLHVAFAFAVRRRLDLGEEDMGAAGAPEEPPSLYAALGGWGPPEDPDVRRERIRGSEDGPYTFRPERVHALEAHGVIQDHGDVTNDATAWALHNLIGG